jgi:exosome complex RNA-binding protein Rrp4
MNKEQLKELVKQHFGLVDKTPVKEAFGEVFDENKAFKIVFPGDTLKVGDEVKVVTKEGQESLAPDGYHKLEDGTMIKTEGSSVVEIVSPEGKTEEEMSM